MVYTNNSISRTSLITKYLMVRVIKKMKKIIKNSNTKPILDNLFPNRALINSNNNTNKLQLLPSKQLLPINTFINNKIT